MRYDTPAVDRPRHGAALLAATSPGRRGRRTTGAETPIEVEGGDARHPPGRARLVRDDDARPRDLQRSGRRRRAATRGCRPPGLDPDHPRALRTISTCRRSRASSATSTRLLTNPSVHDKLPAGAAGARHGDRQRRGHDGERHPDRRRSPPTTPRRTGCSTTRKGRDNGYVLTIGGKRVYIAGDTEDTPEMRALDGIDIAFLPMNLPYTMTVEQAADAVAAFAPGRRLPLPLQGQRPRRVRQARRRQAAPTPRSASSPGIRADRHLPRSALPERGSPPTLRPVADQRLAASATG